MSPEKLHLALNHFVFLLPLAALVPLIVGCLLGQRTTMLCGVCIALIGSAMAGLVMGSGEEAYERYKDGPVTTYLDADAYDALEHHEHMAHDYSKVMYLLLLASIISLAMAFFRPNWLKPTVVVVIVLCVASAIVGVMIADTGGEIRRPDFRDDTTKPVE